VIHHGLAAGVQEVRLAVRADQPKLIDFYTAYEFELAEELEYSHANPLEPAPLVMRRCCGTDIHTRDRPTRAQASAWNTDSITMEAIMNSTWAILMLAGAIRHNGLGPANQF
jgi:hypothetical protein